MSFVTIDYVIAIIILFFGIIGAFKGFINNIFGKLSWILGLAAAFFFYEDLSKIFDTNNSGNILFKILSFIVLFILVFLIVKIIDNILSRIFSLDILRSLDRTLGFFLGIIEGILISGILIVILKNQPFVDSSAIVNNSFFYGIFTNIINHPQIKEISNNV